MNRTSFLLPSLAVVAALLGLGACTREAPVTPATPGSAATAPVAPAASTPAGDDAMNPARELVLGRCTICHDDSYFAQQRLGIEGWQKTVTKMQGFGAPINADEVPLIAAYLGKSFPLDAPDVAPRRVAKPAIGLANAP